MRILGAAATALIAGGFVFLMSGGFLLWMVDLDSSDAVLILSGCGLAVAVAAYTFWYELHG